jgi:hypothetical protein
LLLMSLYRVSLLLFETVYIDFAFEKPR